MTDREQLEKWTSYQEGEQEAIQAICQREKAEMFDEVLASLERFVDYSKSIVGAAEMTIAKAHRLREKYEQVAR